jgi:hypothetical protein
MSDGFVGAMRVDEDDLVGWSGLLRERFEQFVD